MSDTQRLINHLRDVALRMAGGLSYELTPADLDEAAEEFDYLANRITDLEGELEDAQDDADDDALLDQIRDLEDEIADLKDQLAAAKGSAK